MFIKLAIFHLNFVVERHVRAYVLSILKIVKEQSSSAGVRRISGNIRKVALFINR